VGTKDNLDQAIKMLWTALGVLIDIGYSDDQILYVFKEEHTAKMLEHLHTQKLLKGLS
jgi:hypothetical protein